MYRICTISLLSLLCALTFAPSQAEACGMRYKPIAKKDVKKDVKKEAPSLRAAALKSMFDLIDDTEEQEEIEPEEIEQEENQEKQPES